MKRYLVLLSVPIFLGCMSTEESGKEQIQIVHSYLEATLNQDFEQIDVLLAEDFILYGPAFADSLSKEEVIDQWKSDWENLYESIEYKRTGTVFKVVDEGPYVGNWVGDWAIITLKFKDGSNDIKFWYNGTFRVDGNKIGVGRAFYDRADILTQVGYTFTHNEEVTCG